MPVSIVAIGDTHGFHRLIDIPSGDILVHAGDITGNGTTDDVAEFNEYLGLMPHPHKIVIAGNHDFCFERDPDTSIELLTNCIYLQDQSVTIDGIHFYGSPWQPWFFDWAFSLQRGAEIREKWDMIPDDTDVLITHGPPYGHGDGTIGGEAAGCRDLLDAVNRVRPKVHIFGHIHEGAGISSDGETVFINASICGFDYQPVNPPIVYKYNPN